MRVPEEIQQILVAQGTTEDQTLTTVSQPDTTIQTSAIYDNSGKEAMKELYIETEVFDEPGKPASVQLLADPNVNPELFSQTPAQTHVLDLETLEQGQIVGTSEGQILQIVAHDGNTYHIKLEGIENLINLPSINTTSQT